MATVVTPTAETQEGLRRELAHEREELVRAIDSLRDSAHVGSLIETRLPLVLVGAVGLGFVLGGGIGATARLFFRRSREGRTRAVFGPFALVERA
jgi:hypothetical protein